MNYHYKSPEEVRKQFGKPDRLKNPMFNRTFFLLVADVIIILIAGTLLYKSGYADLIKTGEGVLKVEYERLDEAHIRLHLYSDMRDILLVDGKTGMSKQDDRNTAVLTEVRWELDRGDQILILRDAPEFQPLAVKAKEPATLDLTIPETARSAPPVFELIFQNRQLYPEEKASQQQADQSAP